MFGWEFEVLENGNTVELCSLDKTDKGYRYFKLIKDKEKSLKAGENVYSIQVEDHGPNRFKSNEISGDAYRHVIVNESQNGIALVDLPYRPNMYPTESLSSVSVLHHSGDDKYWAIAEDSALNAIAFFKSDITNGRWVSQQLNNSKTISERINEKIAKGYANFDVKKYSFERGIY